MKPFLKSILSNKNNLKFISLIIGYTIWAFMGETHISQIDYDVPISFYGAPHNVTISGPESVKIKLSAQRQELKNIDSNNLAFYIDASSFTYGIQQIKLTSEQLLLPDSIKLLRWAPANLLVTVTEKN